MEKRLPLWEWSSLAQPLEGKLIGHNIQIDKQIKVFGVSDDMTWEQGVYEAVIYDNTTKTLLASGSFNKPDEKSKGVSIYTNPIILQPNNSYFIGIKRPKIYNSSGLYNSKTLKSDGITVTVSEIFYSISGSYFDLQEKVPYKDSSGFWTWGGRMSYSLIYEANQPPTITLSTINNQSILEGTIINKYNIENFSFKITPNDADPSDVIEYSVLLNSNIIQPYTVCEKGIEFTYTILSTFFLNGNNNIQVKVKDNNGAETSVNFIVNNQSIITGYSCLNDLKPPNYNKSTISLGEIIEFLNS